MDLKFGVVVVAAQNPITSHKFVNRYLYLFLILLEGLLILVSLLAIILCVNVGSFKLALFKQAFWRFYADHLMG